MPLDDLIVNDLQGVLLQRIRDFVEVSPNATAQEVVSSLPITYSWLIYLSGRNLPANGIGKHLSAIGDRCAVYGDPRLDCLVVSQQTGRPGKFWNEEEWQQSVIACYNCQAFRS
jgi:hypothetical protein